MAVFGYSATMLNHVAISFDRLHAITQPMTYTTVTKKVIGKRMLMVWTAAALSSINQILAPQPAWPARYSEYHRCPLTKVILSQMVADRE